MRGSHASRAQNRELMDQHVLFGYYVIYSRGLIIFDPPSGSQPSCTHHSGCKPRVNHPTEPMDIYIYGGFLKLGYPHIIHLNRIFHYKSSILGYPLLKQKTDLVVSALTLSWDHPLVGTLPRENTAQVAVVFGVPSYCHPNTVEITALGANRDKSRDLPADATWVHMMSSEVEGYPLVISKFASCKMANFL